MTFSLPVRFDGSALVLLDQRTLPEREDFQICQTVEDVYLSIRDMVVRGAPNIGFSGVFGLALAAKQLGADYSLEKLREQGNYIKSARPTAVNLAYEVDSALQILDEKLSGTEASALLVNRANDLIEESERRHRQMADHAITDLDARLGKEKYNLLTHCNTGFLACGSLGTALGVIQRLGEENRVSNVFVDETRPYLQGSRLTAYELGKLNIPHQIVVEGAASYLMKKGLVDAIFVGADRIVSNGDTANKVGTSSLSIVAKEYGVPFYVVAPLSTFDMQMSAGEEIEIELREESEILEVGGRRVAPSSSRALNPSFDVTDNKFITAIVSEAGVAEKPYTSTLGAFFEG